MRKNILNILFNFIDKFYIPIIAVSLILAIIFFLAFKFIPLKSDYINLLPPKSEPVKNLKYLSEKLKGVGRFSIVISSQKKDIKKMQNTADLLYNDLIKLEEVQYINYKIPKDFILNNLHLFIELEDLEEIYYRLKEKISYELWKDAPFMVDLDEDDTVEFNIDDIIDKYKTSGSITALDSDYMISGDKSILVMFLKPDYMPTEINKTEKLIDKINKVIEKKNINSDIKISYAGTYVLSYDQKNAITKDIQSTSIIALIFIFIAILVFVRKFGNSIFLLYALGVGVLFAFGVAFVFIHHINLITGFLIAILLGLGVNYGIHFLMRYNEELRNPEEDNALKKAFIQTGLASLTGALTTAISFATLSFSKFKGFSEFGILASSGILFTLIATYIIVSALMIFTKKVIFKNKKSKIKKRKENHLFDKFNGNNGRKIILGSSSGLIILTVIGVFIIILLKRNPISFEYNSKKLEVKGQESIETTELIQKKFNISTDPAIFYTFDRKEEMDFYKTIRDMMGKENSVIGNIMSLSGVLNATEIQSEKIKILKLMQEELTTLPEGSITDKKQQETIEMFTAIVDKVKILEEKDLPPTFTKRFIFKEKNKNLYITQVFPNKILFDAKDMKNYVSQIKEIKGNLKSYFPTGMHILYVYLIDTVLDESKIFISLVFLIIWIILLIDFKNLKDSLIAMIPLIFGILWLVQIMSIFQIKFNFMNIIVLPTILGTGVDNGVHIYHRYKETGNIYNAIFHTGVANLAMSITVALGWSALFIAHYQGLKTMAFVGVVGILMTFLASITIMPAVIILTDKYKKAHEK